MVFLLSNLLCDVFCYFLFLSLCRFSLCSVIRTVRLLAFVLSGWWPVWSMVFWVVLSTGGERCCIMIELKRAAMNKRTQIHTGGIMPDDNDMLCPWCGGELPGKPGQYVKCRHCGSDIVWRGGKTFKTNVQAAFPNPIVRKVPVEQQQPQKSSQEESPEPPPEAWWL